MSKHGLPVLTDPIPYEQGSYRRIGRYLEFIMREGVHALALPKGFEYMMDDQYIKFENNRFHGLVAVKGWKHNVITVETRHEFVCYDPSKKMDTHAIHDGKMITIPVNDDYAFKFLSSDVIFKGSLKAGENLVGIEWICNRINQANLVEYKGNL